MGDGKLTATFQLPTKATLRVVPEVGEPWDATAEDLRRFGLTQKSAAYARFHDWFCETLGIKDATGASLNVIRYAVECAIMGYDHMPGSGGDDPEEDAEDVRIVRSIEAAAGRAVYGEETP